MIFGEEVLCECVRQGANQVAVEKERYKPGDESEYTNAAFVDLRKPLRMVVFHETRASSWVLFGVTYQVFLLKVSEGIEPRVSRLVRER